MNASLHTLRYALFCALLSTLLVGCQTDKASTAKTDTSQTQQQAKPKPKKASQPASVAPDTSPLYPGCTEEAYEDRKKCSQGKLIEGLRKALKYPQVAVDNKVNGFVVCEFVILKDGQMTGLNIKKSLTPETDAAAFHAIEDMIEASGPWEPATKDGKNVEARYTLPIQFGKGGK